MPVPPLEADWEFEIGGDAPVIDAAWSGFVDLRQSPRRVDEIPEAVRLSAMRDALLRLNVPQSPLWTAKCDVWQLEEFDADEMGANPETANEGVGCYVDLLPSSPEQWASPRLAQQCCEAWRVALRKLPLANSRVDFVIRRAWIAPDLESTGITAYIAACGADLSSARDNLDAALHALVDTVAPLDPGPNSSPHYNGKNPGE